MIAAFRCSPILKERVDSLVAAGHYRDFSSFCVTAIENQLLLEEGHAPEEASAPRSKGGLRQPIGRHSASAAVTQAARTQALAASRQGSSRALADDVGGAIPEELTLSNLGAEAPFELPDVFADLFSFDQQVPVDRWLFGQYNRVLPVKLSIRALAAIAANEGKHALVLESVGARIADVAARVGDFLRSQDRKLARHRDDAFATAFPESDSEGQKSRVRYQNQFVGHTVRGEQSGALVGLKLATIQVLKNKPHILPTSVGWQFGLLPNPVLDPSETRVDEKFSRAEKDFLLAHIREHIPVELFAYRVLLSMLDLGIGSPEAMNEVLLRLLTEGKFADNNRELVTTQRSGALARMTDLGLVNHERDGRRVSRVLTPEGRRFLSEVGPVQIPPCA